MQSVESSHGTVSRTPRKIHLVLTVPIYNEEERVAECIRRLVPLTQTWNWSTTIVIAEDGSTDRTEQVLRSLQGEFPELIVVTDSVRRGRGLALRRTWANMEADIFAFTDADLPAGTGAVRDTIRAVTEGAQVATASRYAPGAVTMRPPLRSFVSRRYNQLVRVLFADNIQDHQCGIKAFSSTAVKLILAESTEDSWFWDTEALVIANRYRLSIREIPVAWTEIKYFRTSIRRLVSDIKLHGIGLIRLFIRSGSRTQIHSTDWIDFPKSSYSPTQPMDDTK